MKTPPTLTGEPASGHWVNTLDPFLIRFPEGWPIEGLRWYGIAYILGFVVARALLTGYRKKGLVHLDENACDTLILAIVAGTIIGGRLGYLLGYTLASDPGALIRDPLLVFKLNKGGMASHGGMIGIAAGIAWCARKFRLSFASLADTVVTLGPPGIIFGRIANFINGELWGKESDAPWAVVFRYAEARTADGGTLWLTPRHPSQLYAMALEGVALTLWTQWRFRRKVRLPEGRLAGEFLAGYALLRIIGEIWREPDAGVAPVLGMSRGQFYSLFLAAAGMLFVAKSAGWLKKKA